MSNLDVVARLQLNAAQFTSEAGRAAADVAGKMSRAAGEVRQPFVAAFADVSRMAKEALTLPRTSGGSLDLSAEIASLKQSAAAADQRAVAAREMSVAMAAAAAAGKGDAEALRLEADASAVASLAAEREAAAIRTRVASYQAVNEELGHTRSATIAAAQADDEATNSTNRYSNAKAEFQHVLRAVGDGFAAGIPVQQLFSMELGRGVEALALWAQAGGGAQRETKTFSEGAVEAGAKSLEMGKNVAEAAERFTGMRGAAGLVARSLTGEVGLALTFGLAVLTPFVSKLFETESAADHAKDALNRVTQTQSDLAAAIEKTNGRLAEQNRLQAQAGQYAAPGSIREGIKSVKTSVLQGFDDARDVAKAMGGFGYLSGFDKTTISRGQRANSRTSPNNSYDAARLDQIIENAHGNFAVLTRDVAAFAEQTGNPKLEALATKLTESYSAAANMVTATRRLEGAQRDANITLAGGAALTQQSVAANIQMATAHDEVTRAQARLATSTVALNALFEKPSSAARDAQIRKAQAQVIADTNAVAAAQEAAKGNPAATEREATNVAYMKSFLEHALPGVRITSTTGGQHVANSDHYVGRAIDFVPAGGMGSMTKDQVRQLLESNGIRIRRNASGVEQLFGPGDPGHSNHFHVAWEGQAPTTEAYDRKQEAAEAKREAAAKRLADQQREAGDEVLRISAAWDEQPKLIDRAVIEGNKLDEIIAHYRGSTDDASRAIVAHAQAAKQSIQDGLDRPFQQFVRSQAEGEAVQRLVLQGRDAEAQALEWALRLQEQQGPLDDAHLAKLLQTAQRQRAIADALEDQRRIVGLYGSAVGDVQRDVEKFLSDLRTKPATALPNLASGFLTSFNKLQDGLISERLFGGMQREIERYVAQEGGGTTPADMLRQQLGDAGGALQAHVDQTGSALGDFTTAVRYTTEQLLGFSPMQHLAPSGYQAKALLSPATMADLASGAAAEGARPANDNSVLPDAIHELTHATEAAAAKHMSAAELYDHIGANLVTNFERVVGVQLPKGMGEYLKKNLGGVLQGAANGQLGGGIFAAITGSRNNPLASSIGGVLGQEAGKALTKPVTEIFGKTVGKLAGPLGGIVGGVLGNVIGGLFTSIKWANSTVGMNANGRVVGNAATGNGSAALANATGEASSVAAGINQLALQLGAKITSLPGITLGTWNGNYRVADLTTSRALNANNFQMGQNLHDFGQDQQGAIEYAVRYSISHAVISGISQASKNILADGSMDLQSAVTKALMIESIPKDLKAMLDPVGAAVDELNRKWQQTVDALKEGGATAEQMAQAERLYNMQLDQTKASTEAADQKLKDFQTSLKLGSSSPYSLRDQEATAMTALQPFLDQINAGSAIDQSKYQSAAQAYLDVERQLYGSTQQYFDAMDAVQAATSKAISTIDNATPITTSVDSPFIKATADNTATGNDLLSQMSGQLGDISAALASLGYDAGGGNGGGFIGSARMYQVA